MILLKKYIHLLLLLGILLFSFRARYINPLTLADLKPWPDGLEYSLSAYNLYHHHIYGLKLYEQYYPPQYPYGYPLLIIPFYILFGSQPYNAVYCSLFFSLLSIVFAYLIGKELGNRFTGLIAALFVAICFRHIEFSKFIMSESSSAFLALFICWLWLKATDLNTKKQKLLLLFLGVIAGFSISVHLTNCLLIPPVLISLLLGRKSKTWSVLKKATIILFGIILALIPMLIYQFHTFGSPLKTGYQMWDPELFGKFKSFSLKFFAHPHYDNKRGGFITILFAFTGLEKHLYPASMVPLFVVAVLFIFSQRRNNTKQWEFLIFLAIFFSLKIAFLSFYMSQHARHLMQGNLLLMILAACGVTFSIDKGIFKSLTKVSMSSIIILSLFLMTIIQMAIWDYSLPKSSPWIDNREYKKIQDVDRHIPHNAVIISQFIPIFAEHYFTEQSADKRVHVSLIITPRWGEMIAKGQIRPIRYDRSKEYSFLFRLNGALNPRTYNFIRRCLKKDVPVYFIRLPDNPFFENFFPLIKRYFNLVNQERDSRLFKLYLKDW